MGLGFDPKLRARIKSSAEVAFGWILSLRQVKHAQRAPKQEQPEKSGGTMRLIPPTQAHNSDTQVAYNLQKSTQVN